MIAWSSAIGRCPARLVALLAAIISGAARPVALAYYLLAARIPAGEAAPPPLAARTGFGFRPVRQAAIKIASARLNEPHPPY